MIWVAAIVLLYAGWCLEADPIITRLRAEVGLFLGGIVALIFGVVGVLS